MRQYMWAHSLRTSACLPYCSLNDYTETEITVNYKWFSFRTRLTKNCFTIISIKKFNIQSLIPFLSLIFNKNINTLVLFTINFKTDIFIANSINQKI